MMAFHVPEQFRITRGPKATTSAYGNNGFFLLTLKKGTRLFAMAGEGDGWEHVSVSRTDRAPLWEEMCQVKDLFWDAEDCVVQYHPPKSEYINNHDFCLHLWRPIGVEMPRPDAFMVGIK
jgi:hypothetical protein